MAGCGINCSLAGVCSALRGRELLIRLHLRRLIGDPTRVDDELEWIEVLVLFHEFQVGYSFNLTQRLTSSESALGPVECRRGELILPICNHPLCRLDQLSF